MRIEFDEIHALLASSPVITRRPKRRSIDRLLSQVRRSMCSAIEEHMQAPMALLDEAIRFLMAFESFQFARGLTNETREFALHTARLRSDILAVRVMVTLGQESAGLALARVFFEDIEIAMALAIDPEFAVAYGEASQDSDFWSKQIGYGKIYPRVRSFISAGGGDLDTVNDKLQHHKDLKSFLSGHIHPTTSSAFRTAFPPSLEHPGGFLSRPIGSLGSNLRPLCLILADEVHMFSACCINMFTGPIPPPAFAGYKPCGEMDDVIAAAHVLQELIVKYFDLLWKRYDETLKVWDVALDDGGDRGSDFNL
jgi:hypothetical protein